MRFCNIPKRLLYQIPFEIKNERNLQSNITMVDMNGHIYFIIANFRYSGKINSQILQMTGKRNPFLSEAEIHES